MSLYDDLIYNTSNNNAFNAEQAQINRDWNEWMSGTSHQREVRDLIAAGLNPVLSANSGASWNAVGNASADSGAANLAATYLNNQAALEMSHIQAAAQVAAASSAASIAASATRYAAETAAQAARDTAPVHASGGVGPVNANLQLPAYMAGDFVENSAKAYGAAAGYSNGYSSPY